MKAYLLLANGMVFEGRAFGAAGTSVGEVVFNTGMVGYEETLTDPSYYGQIITQTYPLVGNYGVNGEDAESARIWAFGYIVRELCGTPSNFRCQKTLDEFLKEQGIIGIAGVDTRRLTRIIRESGVMNGALTIGTMDGANIEIYNRVGRENIFIFGLTSDEVDALYANNSYRAGEVYERSPILRRVMDQLVDGSLGPNRVFSELYHALLFGDNGGMADPYLVLRDFADYARKQEMVGKLYDTRAWWRSAVINVAQSGYFSSDRTIHEYIDKIWHLEPLHGGK